MAQAELTLKQHGFGQTRRRDTWWLQPLAVFTGLSIFVIYSTWAAFQGEYYAVGPYLSPMYSPELFGESSHSWFGPKPSWWPAALPWSPAFLILWAPLGFRLTCYYYRGAYYKAFWANPVACAVAKPRSGYWGENAFPLILHNVHRYFLYVALLFPFFLAYDVWLALWFTDAATGATSFGLGVGTLVLAINVVLLSGYALGCHSLRHLVGGIRDRLSASPARLKTYNCVSCLNRKHMLWAWTSLVWVGFSDLYVRLCAMGIWTDLRIL